MRLTPRGDEYVASVLGANMIWQVGKNLDKNFGMGFGRYLSRRAYCILSIVHGLLDLASGEK
jgi:hypothetical protein